MIHHQQRRDLAATDPAGRPGTQPANQPANQPAREPDPVDADARDTAAPVVPRQERRPTRDAYDLYAQIYAIRTEDHTS